MNKPVAWMHKNPKYPISKHWSQEYNIPLYTHPVKELTDEETRSLKEANKNLMELVTMLREEVDKLRKAQDK